MKRNSDELDKPVRMGVLKSATIIDENRTPGMRDKWTKEAYRELERSRKEEREILHFSEH